VQRRSGSTGRFAHTALAGKHNYTAIVHDNFWLREITRLISA